MARSKKKKMWWWLGAAVGGGLAYYYLVHKPKAPSAPTAQQPPAPAPAPTSGYQHSLSSKGYGSLGGGPGGHTLSSKGWGSLR